MNYEKFSQKKTPELLKQIKQRKFDCLVLDEAHRIKNRNAAVTKNIWQLHNIKHRLLLTGTPGHDTPEDMFMLLKMLKPATYTSYWKWLDEWFQFKTIYTPHGQVRTPAGIKPSLRAKFAHEISTIAIQRKRSDVMDWAGEPDIIDIPLPVSKEQVKYLDELRKYYQVGEVICQGELDRLIRYRQVCNMPALLGLKGTSPKEDWLLQYIKENKDKHVLVFSNSRKTLERLQNSIETRCYCITGSVPPQRRQELVSLFQAGKINILLLQTQACKEGLTLDRADAEIFYDAYPPASDYLQAKDRMVPTKQENVKSQVVYRLYIKGTFDEVCYHMVDNHTKECDCINNFRRYLNEQESQTT